VSILPVGAATPSGYSCDTESSRDSVSAEPAKSVRKVLAAASIVEGVTGLVAIVDPSLVGRLLLGSGLSDVGAQIGRCFGMAALAVGLACWPDRAGGSLAAPRRAMLVYNLVIGGYLAVLGAGGRATGPLLWPAVAYHALVALALAARWRAGGEVRA
jgi:hypothetical protein